MPEAGNPGGAEARWVSLAEPLFPVTIRVERS